MLNPNELICLAIVAFDHCDRRAHVLLEPVDLRPVLEAEGLIGMPEAVDRSLIAVGVIFEPCCLQECCEAYLWLLWVLGLLGPPSHEQVELAVFLPCEGWTFIDDLFLVLQSPHELLGDRSNIHFRLFRINENTINFDNWFFNKLEFNVFMCVDI